MKGKLGMIVLMGLMVPTMVFAAQNIKLVINGKEITTTVAPVKDSSGSILVPLRIVSSELDAEVKFDNKKQEITITKENKVIKLVIGKKEAWVNGEAVTLKAPAKIVNGTTLVPIRFVSEQLDCEAGLDYKNNKVIIKSKEDSQDSKPAFKESEIQAPKEYMDKAIKEIESKITFQNDIELFTLYAFMNYTGYDDENNKQGFSPVRESLRKELKEMDLDLKNNTYYKDKQINYPDYTEALLHMTKAPEFKYGKSLPSHLNKLNDLPECLNEFYKEANIEELYKQYQKEYDQELDKYKVEAHPAIAKMNYYLGMNNKDVKPFIITTNLLDAYWRGSGLGKNKYLYNDSLMIITGPSDEANIENIVHEYLHGVINPITDELEKEIDSIFYKRKDVPKNSQADGYGNWKSIVTESIIRGIAGKAVNTDGKSIAQGGYDNGFILSMYFYERFDEFKDYEGSLEDFVKKLIVEYK